MKFNNLEVKVRNMTDEEIRKWNAPYPKENEYIVTIYLEEGISDMLPSKIGRDNPFYRRNSVEWEGEFVDKDCEFCLEDVKEIMIDDFLEAFEEDFGGCNYEIEVFKERFEDVLSKYQGEFEEKVQERLEEFSDLREVLTMSEKEAIKLCRNIYLEGYIDFRVEDKNNTVSLEMAMNIYGDEYDLENPFDLVFYDEQGFEHDKVPKMYSKDHDKVEEYDNIVKETLDDLDQIIQYVYDERYSDKTHKVKLGDYYLIIPPYSDY